MQYRTVDILFFAEDPGAVNYIVDLPQVCAKKALSSCIAAAGSAIDILSQRGRGYIPANDFASAGQMLEALKPRLVVVGTSENPESLGLQLISEAGRRGIPTVGVVDAYASADFRFRGKTDDPLFYAPEWLTVPDKETKEEFVNLGFPSDRVKACGHPHYDFVREKREELDAQGKENLRRKYFPGAGRDKIIVLFAAEQEGGLNPQQFIRDPDNSNKYTLDGRGGQTRNDVVLEEFLDAIAQGPWRPYLVLRLHPQSTPDQFEAYRKEFDVVSHKEPALELVYAVDYVFGMTSMLLTEGAILRRPTFSIVPREIERTWLPTVRSELTWCAHTREQIRKMVPEFLAGGSASGAHVDTLIYGASQKAVQFFEEILCSASRGGKRCKGSTING
jgi:hypothetical protein